jgi:putative transcriptional regulator
MPRDTKSASLSGRSKLRRSAIRKRSDAVPRSAIGRRLVAGLNDALAHARGELVLPSYTVTVPEIVDVAKIRSRLGLSQAAFAHTFGLDVTAIHAWEQGRRQPDRAARVLLAVIGKEPQAVMRALSDRG